MHDTDPSLSETRIPPRVQAAQSYLCYALRVREPSSYSVLGDVPLAGNELSPREQSTYEAALDVLLLYFRGEMDYGDVAPSRVSDDGDDPKQRVPVPA